MTEIIEWAEPPVTTKRDRWAAIAKELRSNPNAWALIDADTGDPSVAYRIRIGSIAAFRPAGAFESRGVVVGPGRHDVYARFVGSAQ